MQRVTCSYCGLPFRTGRTPAAGEAVYCCSGCAMASRLGIDGEKFPVTPQLVFGLVYGFVVFNQLAVGLFAGALLREGRTDLAALLQRIDVALGVAVFLGALGWLARARWIRIADAMVFALLAGPLVAGVILALGGRLSEAVWLSFGTNALLGAWQSRGLIRRWWAQRSVSRRE